MTHESWSAVYEEAIARLPGYASGARLTLCGLSACVDAYIALPAAEKLMTWHAPPAALALVLELKRRAALGIGGEMRVDWPGGPVWLDRHLEYSTGLGGTGAQVAQTLALVGAPSLLALADRSREQLAVIDPTVRLAAAYGPVPVGRVAPSGKGRPKHYIFEFTKGRAAGDVVPSRSSRTIVRFADPGLEDDAAFDETSSALAATAGAGVLSGFNGIARDALPDALERVRKLATCWRRAGLDRVHVELGDYPDLALRGPVLSGLRGHFTSLGMSHSELRSLTLAGIPLDEALCALGDAFELKRVCVHADRWAMTATRFDPAQERAALIMGCLFASSRAAAGRPTRPRRIPDGAAFETPPEFKTAIRGWRLVACATPYLQCPAATIGLGDTFLAGCLLVLGQPPLPPPINHEGTRHDHADTLA